MGMGTYGMCASSPRNDYAYHVQQAILAKNPSATFKKCHGAQFEQAESDTQAQEYWTTTANTITGRPASQSFTSDLVNSYAWDTAIIFIQTYSTEEKASTYASQNKSTSFANTGINNDKYCNIWDMSGNVEEWTTEDCDNPIHQNSTWFNVSYRGGKYDSSKNDVYAYTSRGSFGPDSFGTLKVSCGFRISLIVGTAK